MPKGHLPSDTARRRRLLSTSSASAANIGVFIVYQLVSLPVFLSSYGARRYSDWLILYGLTAVFAVVDFGLPGVIGAQMTMLAGGGRHDDARALFSFLRRAGAIWLTAFAVIAFGVIEVTNPVAVLSLHATSVNEARLTLILLCGWLIMSTYWGIYSAAYQSCQHYARNLGLIARTRAVEFAVLIAAAALSAPLAVLAAVVLGARVLMTLVIHHDCRRVTPWYQPASSFARFDTWPAVRKLISPAIASLAFPAGNAIQNQGVLIVVGSTAGAAAVVAVNSIRTVTNSLYNFNVLIKAGVAPELSALFGAGDFSSARAITQKLTAILTSANLALGVVITAIGPLFLTIWSHGHIHTGWVTFAWFSLTTVTDSAWLSMTDLAFATNRHQPVSVAYLVACVLAVGLMYPLLPILGISAVAISLFATGLLCTAVSLPLTCSLLLTTPEAFTRGVLQDVASSTRDATALVRRLFLRAA